MWGIPWKYICMYLLYKNFGPEISFENLEQQSKALSDVYCQKHDDKVKCVFEQARTIVQFANQTYHVVLKNLTRLIDESGIKKYWQSKSDVPSILHRHPSPNPSEDKLNVKTAMSNLLNQMEKKMLPVEESDKIKERLKTIATKTMKSNGVCSLKIGVDPMAIAKLIDNVAQLTNMPEEVKNILTNTIETIDGESGMVKNTNYSFNGKVHYVLIAAYRNGKTNKCCRKRN